jgi:hypothetical protein
MPVTVGGAVLLDLCGVCQGVKLLPQMPQVGGTLTVRVNDGPVPLETLGEDTLKAVARCPGG